MRKQRPDLLEVNKIMHGLEDLPSDLLFKPICEEQEATT